MSEDGTGVRLEGSGGIKVRRQVLDFENVGKEKYIKPNLPFTGKVRLRDISHSGRNSVRGRPWLGVEHKWER